MRSTNSCASSKKDAIRSGFSKSITGSLETAAWLVVPVVIFSLWWTSYISKARTQAIQSLYSPPGNVTIEIQPVIRLYAAMPEHEFGKIMAKGLGQKGINWLFRVESSDPMSDATWAHNALGPSSRALACRAVGCDNTRSWIVAQVDAIRVNMHAVDTCSNLHMASLLNWSASPTLNTTGTGQVSTDSALPVAKAWKQVTGNHSMVQYYCVTPHVATYTDLQSWAVLNARRMEYDWKVEIPTLPRVSQMMLGILSTIRLRYELSHLWLVDLPNAIASLVVDVGIKSLLGGAAFYIIIMLTLVLAKPVLNLLMLLLGLYYQLQLWLYGTILRILLQLPLVGVVWGLSWLLEREIFSTFFYSLN